MTAVLSGHADIGFSGPEACIYVYNEGKDDYGVFAQADKKRWLIPCGEGVSCQILNGKM